MQHSTSSSKLARQGNILALGTEQNIFEPRQISSVGAAEAKVHELDRSFPLSVALDSAGRQSLLTFAVDLGPICNLPLAFLQAELLHLEVKPPYWIKSVNFAEWESEVTIPVCYG